MRMRTHCQPVGNGHGALLPQMVPAEVQQLQYCVVSYTIPRSRDHTVRTRRRMVKRTVKVMVNHTPNVMVKHITKGLLYLYTLTLLSHMTWLCYAVVQHLVQQVRAVSVIHIYLQKSQVLFYSYALLYRYCTCLSFEFFILLCVINYICLYAYLCIHMHQTL